jgi:hypothetical protein
MRAIRPEMRSGAEKTACNPTIVWTLLLNQPALPQLILPLQMCAIAWLEALSDRLLIAAQTNLIKEQGETERLKCPNQKMTRNQRVQTPRCAQSAGF